jgi:hypothetical protein
MNAPVYRPTPPQFAALVGRVFRDIGPNGLDRCWRVVEIKFDERHHYGPWLARVTPAPQYARSGGYRGGWRSCERFLKPGEYREILETA